MHKKRLQIDPLEARRCLSVSGISTSDTLSDGVLDDESVWINSEDSEGDRAQIIHGNDATTSDYPWTVSLSDRFGFHFCGGSLIAPTTVVTAAHCVDFETPDSFDVIAGRTRLSSGDGEVLQVAEIAVHPDFDFFTLDSDIAVLTLERPSSLRPIALADRGLENEFAPPGTLATATGWGETESGFGSDTLQVAQLPIVAHEVANSPDYYGGIVTENMIVAGYDDGSITTCYGDSGGPLVVPGEGGEPILVGLTSWGSPGCTEPMKPTVFTRVSSFVDWIESFVPSGTARLTLSSDAYVPGDILDLSLVDLDLPDDATPEVTFLAAGGDTETLALSWAGVPGHFAGRWTLFDEVPVKRNGRLEVELGDELVVIHDDVSDKEGRPHRAQVNFMVVDDDHGNSASNATFVTEGSGTPGNIQYMNDVDWFSFAAVEGQTWRLTTDYTGTLFSAGMRLVGSDGVSTLVTADPFFFETEIIWTAPADGVFYAEVSGMFGDQGTYTFRAETLVDDHGNQASTATELPIGVPKGAAINYENDVDWFAITLERGDVLDAHVRLDGTLQDSTLSLYAGDGRTWLDYDDDGGGGLASHIEWLVRESGTYYLEVAAFLGTGSYTLDVTIRDVERIYDDHGNTADDATSVIGALPVKGIVDFAGDDDWFRFEAEAESPTSVRLQTVEPFWTELNVFGQDGETVIGRREQPWGSEVSFVPDESGTYYARVSGSELRDIGAYQFQVNSHQADRWETNNEPGDATLLPDEGGRFEELTIHRHSDVDWYEWTAPRDGTLAVDLVFDAAEGDLDVALFDHEGTTLARGREIKGGDTISHPVVVGETYRLRVLGWHGAVGSYGLLINPPEVVAADRFESNDTTDQSVPIGGGSQFHPQLSLHSAHDEDWFLWTALDDGTLTAEAHDGTSNVPLDVTLLRADGEPMISGASMASISVTGGLRYFVRISAPDGTIVPNYDVRIDGPPARQGDFNLDGRIDALDASILFFQFGSDGTADLNHDQIVDGADAAILFANWTMPREATITAEAVDDIMRRM